MVEEEAFDGYSFTGNKEKFILSGLGAEIRKTEYLEKKTVLILHVRFSEPDDLAGEVNMPVWTQQGTARWEPVSGAAYYELRLI